MELPKLWNDLLVMPVGTLMAQIFLFGLSEPDNWTQTGQEKQETSTAVMAGNHQLITKHHFLLKQKPLSTDASLGTD